jgi:benzylsuccinate CoA-transferase BbsF subunit
MQGRGGPHSIYAGYGQNACNFSGFTELSGWTDRMPSAPHGAYTDYVCARLSAFALIAALIHRRKTGQGQLIEQSQFESSLHFLMPGVMDYQVNGNIMHRDGNRTPIAAPHGIFQCKGEDRWIAISTMDDTEWSKFCQILGNPGLSTDPDYVSLDNRKKNEDKLEKLVTEWTSTHTAEEIEELLQKACIPVHIVSRPSDVYKILNWLPVITLLHWTIPLWGARNLSLRLALFFPKHPASLPCLRLALESIMNMYSRNSWA